MRPSSPNYVLTSNGRWGLGSVIQRGIHAVVDAAPLPAKTKQAIKTCQGCANRAVILNRAVKDIRHPFGTFSKT